MKKLLLSALFSAFIITIYCQTTFHLQLVAEGNFGTPNGDVFIRNTTVTPATSSTGIYQQTNSSTGLDVFQDYAIAGNKAILLSKGTSFSVRIASYPSLAHVQTFTGVGAPQTIAVASPAKAYVSLSNPSSIHCVNLSDNTISQVSDPNSAISSYSNHMVYANGFIYAQIAAKVVKIDTATNAVVGSFTPAIGSITGLVTDDLQQHVWIMGNLNGGTLKSLSTSDDQLGSAITLTGVTSTKNVRYYNGYIYFWVAKNLHRYNIAVPNIPTTSVYLSALPGGNDPFGYTRAFDIDETTGDFVIGSANNYTAPSYYEVVDGASFSVIESGTMPGCAIVNRCVLKTYHVVTTPDPVPDVASLPSITGECSAELTAPTATGTNGSITGTTTDPVSYTAQGTYTVTWTYTQNEASVTQEQTVVIDDVTAPVPVSATLPAVNGECEATVTAPTATDNCAGTLTAQTTDPLTYDEAGTYTIHWTYSDGNGNSAEHQQTVIINDVTDPVPNMAVLPVINGDCQVTVTAPTATDNCSGTLTAQTTDPLTYTQPGTYTVHWTYTDGSGNTTEQNQSVVITCTLGLEEFAENEVIVYPNPATTVIYYSISGVELLSAKLAALSGAVVKMVDSGSEMNVEELPAGIYFLGLETTDGIPVKTVKVIVE